MAAYIIIQSRTSDPEPMVRYRDAVMPLISRFGGKHIVRGAVAETLEGINPNGRLAILEFPSLDVLRAFWNSPEYELVKKLRHGAADFDAWALAGVE